MGWGRDEVLKGGLFLDLEGKLPYDVFRGLSSCPLLSLPDLGWERDGTYFYWFRGGLYQSW